MICGNCKQSHQSVAQVRSCYEAKTEPAKENQINRAHQLYRERDPFGTCLEGFSKEEAEEMINSATKSGISKIIEELEVRPLRKAEEPLSDGYYKRKDGSIWKSYYSQNGQLICKELVVYDDNSHEWSYRGASRRFLSAATKLTLEDAKKFGTIYGFCCVCGRTLTNGTSIEAGIGPVCAGRLYNPDIAHVQERMI